MIALLENELELLKKKREENMQSAYENIFNGDETNRKNELEEILKFYGIDYKIKAESFENQLEEIRELYDINYRLVVISKGWSKNNILPMILKKGDDLNAILPSLFCRNFYYENGKKTRVDLYNETNFENNGLCFYKGFNKENVSRFSLIFYILKSIRPIGYLTLILIMVLTALFSLVMPEAEYYIFNNVIPSGVVSDVFPIGSMLFGIVIISFVMFFIKETLEANVSIYVDANLQTAILSRLFKLKMNFFSENKAGELCGSLMTMIERLNDFSAKAVSSFFAFLLSVIYIVRMEHYAEEYMSLVFGSFFVFAVLIAVNIFYVQKYKYDFSKSTNEMAGFVYEVFGAMENIKLNNADSVMFRRWSDFYSKTLKAYEKPFVMKHFKAIYMLITMVYTILFFHIGKEENINSANFITFMTLYGLFIGSIGLVTELLTTVAEFNSAYNQTKDFFNEETEKNENKQSLESFLGNVEFSNVSFKYSNSDEYVLDKISFSVGKGKKIGITGKSGCGKSTLLKLLLGFEKAESGRIFIDNVDLNEINLASYRNKIGVILQNSKLIPADIFSNITLTKPKATYQEVEEVLDIVGLREEIEKMPMGLYTFVSDDNLTISLGQKQRILLARAIIQKPSLLILDEATNSLDNLTQRAVTEYIEKLDATAIIVAHRLSTIKNCDEIFFIDNGRVAEKGNFNELIEMKGEFYNLAKEQL